MKFNLKVIAFIMCCFLSLVGCSSKPNSSVVSSGDLPSSFDSVSKIEANKYFDTDFWKLVPIVSQQSLDMGYSGGEGCQWMTFLAFDRIDGSTAYACVDVGGILKSTDGGKSWNMSSIGLDTEGSTGATVDPTNKARVIVIGASAYPNSKNGLYLSTDEGFSWSAKFNLKVKGTRDFRRQIAFDESSYDEAVGGCKTIYWSTENIAGLDGIGLYKSTDGGNTWNLISKDYAGYNITVHPKSGALYLANESGLFISTDGGSIVKPTSMTEKISYIDTSKSAQDKIFITADNDFYVYDTVSNSATAMGAVNYPSCATYLSVAQSNSDIMVLQDDRLTMQNQYNNTNYYSKDGGKTWNKSNNNYTGAFIPYNPRQNPSAIHPTNPNIVIKLGGDFIMRSEDGGVNYKLSNDGNGAICVGGMFNFNVDNPNLIAISAQDYNGGYSIDGGKTWKYINWSGLGWGGHAYGSYMIDENTIVAGVAESWQSKRELCVTFDGGNTIERTGLMLEGSTVGIGIKGNKDLAFFGDYRTTDGGKTWNKMNGCLAVFASNADGSKLFGSGDPGGYGIVMSEDYGVSWKRIYTNGTIPTDMAFSDKTNELYIADGTLYKINVSTCLVTKLNVGMNSLKSVAVDPQNNSIVYAASDKHGVSYAHDSAWRSIDGGKSWVCLNRSVGDGREGPDGGRASYLVRVDGEGNAWFVGWRRGIWKIARPNL